MTDTSSVGLSIAAVRLPRPMRSSQAPPANNAGTPVLFPPIGTSSLSAFALVLSRLLRFLLHSPCKACRARIGLCRLGGCGNVIHFGHGQLAHSVLCVFRVAAAKVDILNVTHFEQDVRGRCGGGELMGVALEVSCAESLVRYIGC